MAPQPRHRVRAGDPFLAVRAGAGHYTSQGNIDQTLRLMYINR